MKTNSEKEKFIELRVNGVSYDKISQELGISKPTLIKWGREYHREISNRLYIDYEALISEYSLKKKSRVESLAIVLRKALEELKSRSFEDLNVKDLLFIIQQLDKKILEEVSPHQYLTGEYYNMHDEFMAEMGKEVSLPFSY